VATRLEVLGQEWTLNLAAAHLPPSVVVTPRVPGGTTIRPIVRLPLAALLVLPVAVATQTGEALIRTRGAITPVPDPAAPRTSS